MLKKIFDFVKEYLLIIGFQLQGLVDVNPSLEWKQGDRGNVILIHGFWGRWVSLKRLGGEINRLGYRVHVLPLNYNLESIQSSVRTLEKYIYGNELKKFHIIAHSKGGLIAKYFLDYSAFSVRVEKVITIATPYGGTVFGYLKVFNLGEVAPKSRVLMKINLKKENLHKIVNLYPASDNHVIPNSNLILPGAKNIIINVVGHTRILMANETLEVVGEILEN